MKGILGSLIEFFRKTLELENVNMFRNSFRAVSSKVRNCV